MGGWMEKPVLRIACRNQKSSINLVLTSLVFDVADVFILSRYLVESAK